MKLAKFETLGGYPLVLYYPPETEPYTDMVRVSEYVEIDFPPRTAEELVPAQVALIDKKIAQVSKEFGDQLAALKDAKDKLLAITDQREVA